MAAVKKKAAKKKVARKKAVVKKKAAKKKIAGEFRVDPKLGHDPLAWMAGSEDELVSRSNIVVEPEPQTEVEQVPVAVKAVSEETVETVIDEPEEIVVEQEIAIDEQPDDVSNDEGGAMLNLPDIFGIAQAEVMYKEITNQLASMDEIQIDASLVESVDAAALQLLISLVNECKAQDKKISWHAMSDKINESAKLLNLSDALGL